MNERESVYERERAFLDESREERERESGDVFFVADVFFFML